MKNLTLQTLLLLLLSFGATAQTVYSTGFDNSADTVGWKEYRKGYLSPTYDWMVVASGLLSPPKHLFHDFAFSSTAKVVDWFVSPVFSFENGGSLDSVMLLSYAIGGAAGPDDHFGVYLLNGSPDPALATITLLNDATPTGPSSSYHTVKNITIAPVSGPSYIAFKYTSLNKWFDARADNLSVTHSLPPATCDSPDTMILSNVTDTSFLLTWPSVANATGYEYAVTTSATPPASGTPTTDTFAMITGLIPQTTYYTYVRAHIGSVYSNWAAKSFVTPTGIDDISSQQNISLYPNPATDMLTITNMDKAPYVITDLAGRAIIKGTGTGNTTNIQVSSLRPGIYLLHFTGNGKELVTKFSKE